MYSLFKNAREPMSSYTHFLGVIFAAVGTIFLDRGFFGADAGFHPGLWRVDAGLVQCKLDISLLQRPRF